MKLVIKYSVNFDQIPIREYVGGNWLRYYGFGVLFAIFKGGAIMPRTIELSKPSIKQVVD